jgi:LPXTG-motif cell wall-anchored protein
MTGALVAAGPASAADLTLLATSVTDVTQNFGACGTAEPTPPSGGSLREALCYADYESSVGISVDVQLMDSATYQLTNGPLNVGTRAGDNISITTESGGNATIAGDGTHQVMTIDPNLVGGVAVHVSNLTFTGGRDNQFGGGAIIGGSGDAGTADELTIDNSTFSNNSANSTVTTTTNSPGGAIQFIGGTLAVSDSTFSNNSSNGSAGGAIAYQATGADPGGEALTIGDSTFSGNSATAIPGLLPNGGGAIVVDDVPGTTPMSITDSTFTSNAVSGSFDNDTAAALWLRGGSLSLLHSTFTGNGTGAGVAAIAVSGGALTAHYNRISGNGSGLAVLGGTADATDNWWGCNGGPGASGCGAVTPATSSVYTPYLVAHATATPSLILSPTVSSTIGVDLLTDSAGTPVSATNLTAFAGLPVSFGSPQPGGTSLSAGSVALTAGAASVQYLSGTGKGAGSVSTTFDGAQTTVQVGIAFAPTVTSAASTTFSAGVAKTFTIATTGYPASAITSTGALPAGVTLADKGNGTATLAGTAALGSGGDYPLTITATNVQGNVSQSFVLHVVQAPTATSANAATFAAGTPGSFTVQTSGFPATGTITATGALPDGVTFVDNGDGTATIAGTPAAKSGGAYPLTIAVDNGVTPNASQAFTLTVTEAASFETGSSATFAAGTAASFPVRVYRGFPAPTVAITTTSTLPTGITLVDNGDGTAAFTGTPAAGSGGVYPVTITASGVSLSQSFLLTVNAAPVIILPPDAQRVISGHPVVFNAFATGFPAPTVQWMVSTDGGLVFSDVVGADFTSLVLSPGQSQNGDIYRAVFTNSLGSVSADAKLTVGTAPTISSPAGADFLVNGTSQSFTVTTSGAPDASLAATGLPAWLTLTDNGDGTGTLSGTPPVGSGGPHSFTITAGNTFGTDASQTFVLTVEEAPTVEDTGAGAFVVGTPGTFFIVTTLGFPTATAITVTGDMPSGLFFQNFGNGAGAVQGTPAPGTGGTHTVTVTATNGSSLQGARTVVINVDEAPAFTSATDATFVAGAQTSFTVSTTGFPVAAIGQSGTLPSGLTFTDNGDGTATIAGIPAAGTAGDYPLALSATNLVTTAGQALTLHVVDAPTISSSAATTFTAGAVGSLLVTTTGHPAVTTITSTGTLPQGVTLVDHHDGTATLAGTPAAGSGGVYPLTISASNGVGAPATQSFVLTVDEAPAITSAASATFVAGTAGMFTVRTTGYPAATLGAMGGLPDGVTFVDNGDATATIAGTPAAGTGGVATLTITTSNGALPDAAQSFALTVDEAPAITVPVAHQTVTAGDPVSLTAAASGFPVPTLQWQVSTNGGSSYTDLNGETGATLDFTARQSQDGNLYRALFTSTAGSVSSEAILTVGTAPSISSAATTTFGVDGSAHSFAVTATGIPSARFTDSGGLPAWLTLTDNGDGTATLHGTPSAGDGGPYAFTILASNGFGPTAAQPFTLIVTEPVTVTSGASSTFGVGSLGTFTVTTSGGYPTASTLGLVGALPAGVTFVDNGDGTATFAGVPHSGTGGSYPLTISANNGAVSTQAFTLVVTEDASITSAAKGTITRGVASHLTITTGHAFPAAVALTEAGALPAGITFVDNGDGTATIAGTSLDPAADFPIAITASNGVGTDATQSLTLSVANAPVVPLPLLGPPVGDGPLAGAPSHATPGQSFSVTGDGFAGDATITFGIYSSPIVLGTSTANAAGQVTVTFTIPVGFSGQHSLVIAGTGANGAPRFLRSDVTVTTSPASATVAFTGPGENVSLLATLGLFVVLLGAVMLLRRRRRRI